MFFGETDLSPALEGAVLAHSCRAGGMVLKKGHVLSLEDIHQLLEAGATTVTVAQLGAGDVHEDEAARRCAAVITGIGLAPATAATGRVNIHANGNGLLLLDTDCLRRLNRIDERITVATLPDKAPLAPRQMAATVKIIPFSVPEEAVRRWEEMAETACLSLAPFEERRCHFIQTRLGGTKESVLDKTTQVLTSRLATVNAVFAGESRCGHDIPSVVEELQRVQAEGGCDLVVLAGASAVTDRRDVLPAAMEAAGGEVLHFGMPVDPGNLLVTGRLGDMDVIGMPGCARSPKLNGFDWVLQRLCAGLEVTRADIMDMGVGGLLKEIPSRPLPRAAARPVAQPEESPSDRIDAIVLAAGMSRRMGPQNKLLVEIDGQPMIRRVVEQLSGSSVRSLTVVTGHEEDAVRQALQGCDVSWVRAGDFELGLSASLKAGVAALPADSRAALVCLGDMPRVSAQNVDQLVSRFAPDENRSIGLPTYRGKRGNPVLIGSRFFPEVMELSGDVGARHLISEYPDQLFEVELDDMSILTDIDTPDALEKFRRDGS